MTTLTPTPSPSPTIDIPEISIRFGHYGWPFFWAVVCLLICGACIYAAIHEIDNYRSSEGMILALGVGAFAAAVIGIWQFATFYSRARTWARAFGGLGSVVAAVLVGGFLLWTWDNDR